MAHSYSCNPTRSEPYTRIQTASVEGPCTLLTVGDHSRVDLPTLEAGGFDTGIAYGLAITETHLFTTTNTGLSIYDMSDPIDPEPVSATGDGRPWFCVTVDGSFVYAGGASGFAVIDISDIRRPEIVGRFSDGGDVYNVQLFDHYRRHRRVRYRRSSPSCVPVQVVGISGDTGCLCVWTDAGHDHENGSGGPRYL